MATLTLTDTSKEVLRKNPVTLSKWIVGLRSGKWIQTYGAMTEQDNPSCACCLMVLEAECNGKTTSDYVNTTADGLVYVQGMPSSRPNALKFTGEPDGFMPEFLTAKYIYDDDDKKSPITYSPMGWNDSLKLSFEQIADLLENGSITLQE